MAAKQAQITPDDVLCFEHELFEATLMGSGVQRLIDIVEPLLSNPILVGNGNLDVLGHTSVENVDDAAWTRLVTDDASSHFGAEEKARRLGVVASSIPTIHQLDGYAHRSMICTAEWRGKTLAYVVALECFAEFNERSERYLAIFAKAVAHAIAFAIGDRSVTASDAEQRFLNLLEGTVSGEEAHTGFLQRKTDGCWRILFAKPVLIEDAGQSIPPHLLAAMRYDLPYSIVVERDGGITILVEIPRPKAHSAESALDEDWIKNIEAAMSKRGLFCGISNAFSDVRSANKMYRQAKCALELGRRYGFMTSNQCEYADVALLDLLETAHVTSDTASCFEPKIADILDYDNANGTSWFATYATFVLCGCNRRLTSERLCIHRSTLQYRLGRIKEVLGCEPDDPALAGRAYIAVIALRYCDPEDFDDTYGIDPSIYRVRYRRQ